jgi:hypothetical protein
MWLGSSPSLGWVGGLRLGSGVSSGHRVPDVVVLKASYITFLGLHLPAVGGETSHAY